MSLDYSKELAFELSSFKGLNKRTDPNKLSPGEFVQLDDMRVEDGSLRPEKTDASLSMSLPALVQSNNSVGSYASFPDLTGNPAINTHLIRVSGDNTLSAYEPRTVFIAGHAAGATAFTGKIYTNSSANAPGTDITDGTVTWTPIAQTTGHQWMGFTVAPTASVSDYWIGWQQAAGAAHVIYANTTASADIDWMSNNSGSWAVDDADWTYVVARPLPVAWASTVASADHIVPIELPYESYPVVVSGSTRAQTLTSGTSYSDAPLYCTVAISASGGTEHRMVASPGLLNQTLTASASANAYIIPRSNLVVRNSIVAITAPNAGYCIPIGVTDTVETFDAYVYNGVLFFTGSQSVGGSQAGNGAVDLLNTGLRGFGRPWPVANPGLFRSINEVGACLLYSGLQTVGNKGNMYYSLAGIIDSFTTDLKEIIDTTRPILEATNFNNDIIYSFSNQIKLFSGVPGYASLRTIWPEGIGSKHLIQKTKVGVFFLFLDGLYLYNGTWQLIPDSTKILDNGSRIGYGYKYQIKDLPDTNELFINIDGNEYSKSIIYDYRNNYFRETTGIDNSYIRSLNDGWEQKIVQASGKTIYEGGTTYKGGVFETGWLDPNPEIKDKHFDRIVLEVDALASSYTASASATFDNNSVVATTLTFTKDSSEDTKECQWRTDIEANKVKIKVELPNNASEQAGIHNMKVIYSPTLYK